MLSTKQNKSLNSDNEHGSETSARRAGSVTRRKKIGFMAQTIRDLRRKLRPWRRSTYK